MTTLIIVAAGYPLMPLCTEIIEMEAPNAQAAAEVFGALFKGANDMACKILCEECGDKRALIFTWDRRKYCSMICSNKADERNQREKARLRAELKEMGIPDPREIAHA